VELRQVVAEYVEIRASSWSGARQRAQWLASFENHVYRYTDGVPVSEIDTQTVTRILRPLWGEKRETARRVRMRLERVLGYAKTQRYRSGDNPAAWKDNLDLAFTESDTTKHLRAVPFADVPALYRRIAQIESVPAYALRLQILTVPRTDGLRKARKTEFDLASGVWVIPKERTKTRRSDHRIPLSAEAIRVVEKAARVAEGEYLFPGSYYGRPLSDMACIMVMRRMGRDEVPHGFRSTFKDWASECTEHPNIVSEMALGHAVGNKVEAAYRRGDLFEKRISLMNDWAGYCTSQLILHNVSIPFETT
jgi:integrase